MLLILQRMILEDLKQGLEYFLETGKCIKISVNSKGIFFTRLCLNENIVNLNFEICHDEPNNMKFSEDEEEDAQNETGNHSRGLGDVVDCNVVFDIVSLSRSLEIFYVFEIEIKVISENYMIDKYNCRVAKSLFYWFLFVEQI